MAGDQAQRFAADETGDADNADANARGGVLFRLGKNKNPRSKGLRGIMNAIRLCSLGEWALE